MAISIVVPKHRIGVNVVCVDDDHKILLLKHLFHPLAPWGLPGGWMDRNESPAECASRELFEETGFQNLVVGNPLSIVRNPGPDHINIIFEIKINQRQPIPEIDGSEIVDFQWVSPETVPNKLTAETIIAITKVWETRQIEFSFPEENIEESSF